ncbi:MAG: type II toxin-antitoxin system death-on-curing family toxin [Anaerolineales bacterium]
MEKISSEIVYPTIEQIIDVNRRMIEISGGSFTPPDNFRNFSSLSYILVAIVYPIYGINLFSTLIEKAAGLAYEIIASHIFLDGNKRTGLHIAWEFLKANGVEIYLDASAEEIALGIANKEATRDDLVNWLINHIEH